MLLLSFIMTTLLLSCQKDSSNSQNQKTTNTSTTTSGGTLFTSIPSNKSGVQFNNRITETATDNYFVYNYFYNGAGVAVGDVNNDGKPDLYFSGNQVANKLYINKGDFRFEDATQTSGTGVSDRWCTGVSIIDVNQDGWLDIYVSVAGNVPDAKKRQNLLFINQKDGSFVESAEVYGLADQGYSTQAYFWDYDNDNDIDVYVVNHRVDFKNNSKISSEIARDIKPASSDQLYENRNGKFINVTSSAGIANKTWGLSASIADFDENGWPDIYVANDFLEPDMLYLNGGNGKFVESSKVLFKHISFYGMGSDVADINNDGLMDLYVLDMVSEDHVRSKRNMASMSNSNFWNMVKYGFHRQYMINTLQLNNGNGSYSEIASMAGTSKTDWSWAPLIADFDMDGYRDIFVTNGIKRDVTDNDFKIKAQNITNSGEKLTADRALSMMNSVTVSNYAFKNNGDLTFNKSQKRWGLDQLLNSNGAMYADLDSDGDLDLIVNNLDAVASIYKNNANSENYLRISLKGPQNNQQGVGAQIRIMGGGQQIVQDIYPCRGFMSSYIGDAVIPTGEIKLTTLEITWSDGKYQKISVGDDNKIILDYSNANSHKHKTAPSQLFSFVENNYGISYVHKENEHDDFIKEILIPHRQSRLGPAFATGDINGDGWSDLVFGGAIGQARELFVQSANQFISSKPITASQFKEDVACELFDADGDGDLDLYMVCGGNEYAPGSKNYQDQLFINNGQGQFSKVNALPSMPSSGRCIAVADYDGDGDIDVFIGGGSRPQHYPLAERSYLLENNNGKFTDKTPEYLTKPGIISSATWSDIDNNGELDLIFAGEWTPVFISRNDGKSLSKPEAITKTAGWYFNVSVYDIDNNGRKDIIAGNIGLNNKFQPTADRPLHLYYADFDDNGSFDIVLSKDKGKYKLPVRGRECSSEQMPFIAEKFPTYQAFAEADLSEIYGDKLDDAVHLEVHEFAHHVLFQDDDGGFTKKRLPNSTQRSPMTGFEMIDLNGQAYYAYAGNFYPAEVETVRYDSGIGGLLHFDQGEFVSIPYQQSGIKMDKDIRHLDVITLQIGHQALIGVPNNDSPVFLLTTSKN